MRTQSPRGVQAVRRIKINRTGVGEVFVEQAIKSGLKNAGMLLGLPAKQEIMVYLRQLMEEGRLHLPYDPELINEMNAERALFAKTGQIRSSHPSGTQDDQLWALALAVYVSRHETPSYHSVALLGENPNWMGPRIRLRPVHGLGAPWISLRTPPPPGE